MSSILLVTALISLPIAIVALTEEFEFKSTGDSFVLEGSYESGQRDGKEFWLCIDYDSTSRTQNHFAYTLKVEPDLLTRLLRRKVDAEEMVTESLTPNVYPVHKCGGSMRATKSPYWYALHGVWKNGGKELEIRFVSAFEIWVETWSTNVKPIDHEFALDSNVISSVGGHIVGWKLVQKHGETTNGLKRSTISVLNLIGSGKVDTMRPLSEDTTIFVRLNGYGAIVKSYTVDLPASRNDQFNKFYERLR